MKTMTYKEQLLHPNWQRLRLQMLEAAQWECSRCGGTESTLHVHHRQYFKNRMAWEYSPEELTVLCSSCHEAEHIDLDVMKNILAILPAGDASALLGGFHKFDDWIDPAAIESCRQNNPLAFAAGVVAYMAYSLSITDMLKVAEFSASLMNENSEPRLCFTHGRGNVFGEESADA